MKNSKKSDEVATNGSGGYQMTISRMTVDKLGVKLYDKVSAVIAELVANGYDADADEVTVEAPMGVTLASFSKGVVSDNGYSIIVRDTGHGMSPDVVNQFHLKVGGERRDDPKRGDTTSKYLRKVMGRKGLGKLAPFGICGTLEIISSGGDEVDGKDEDGNPARGFKTAHFIMRRDDILKDNDDFYKPDIGRFDGTVQPKSGTVVKMTNFSNRRVPQIEDFSRQLSRRFGLPSKDWKIKLVDTNSKGTPGEMVVGDFKVETMPGTKIIFDSPTTESVDASRRTEFTVKDEKGGDIPDTSAGFMSENGKFYPVKGWVGYAKQSYRDDLMAGIRIYCRGKIAAQTAVFNMGAGFTGEHSVRSYLVGEIHADWLDEEEDLIQTNRRDILWSDELGRQFEEWGREIVCLVGRRSLKSARKNVWKDFVETGNVKQRVEEAYPGKKMKDIRKRTMYLAKIIGERLNPNDAKDGEYVDSIIGFSLAFGPHYTLTDALKEAASEEKIAMSAMTSILKTARVAELASYGMIAEERVKIIEQVDKLKNKKETPEKVLHELIYEAPWLINPFWSPILSNQAFSRFRGGYKNFVKEKTGDQVHFHSFKNDDEKKPPDFVLIYDNFDIRLVELKRPQHRLVNEEWDRIQTYIDLLEKFLENLDNDLKNKFESIKITLVCDRINLDNHQKILFEHYKEKGRLKHLTWNNFFRRTEKMHADFLGEAKRQKEMDIKK